MTPREAIQEIAKKSISFKGIRVGTVVSVDDSTRTCTVNVLDSGTDLDGVRLHCSGVVANGAYYKPSIGSVVGVVPLFEFEYAVVLWSELDSITLLDGSYDGLVKSPALTTKLNNLENKVNDLITFINTHSHASNGSPPSPPFTGGDLTLTNQSEIENPLITHGTV